MNTIAWRLLALCSVAIALTLVLQYAFIRRVDAEVLTYIIPACIVSYVLGRRDAIRGDNTQSRAEGSPNKTEAGTQPSQRAD
jgi:hypothetical protein